MTTPIDLFRIVMGARVWTLTSADTDQFYDAGSGMELYSSISVGRGGNEQKNEISKANLDVSIPIDHELAYLLLTSYSEQIMSLTVFTKRDTTEVTWKGRLASIKPEDAKLTMVFESVFTSLRRPGLRARYQKSCRHALYGRGCKLDPEDFAVAGTLAALSGVTLTVAAAAGYSDGYFLAGMVRAPDGALSYVVAHTGSSLTLQRRSNSLENAFASTGIATAVQLYPGCDHSRATCLAKFNNLLRYGGFDWIPQKNPMGGSSIV